MSIFDDLYTSLQEAVEIKQDKAQASRITHHEVADKLGRGHFVDTGGKKYSEAGIKRG